MPRTRSKKENVEKKTQPRITDYFNERKSRRKLSLDDLKDNEQSIKRFKKSVINVDQEKINTTNSSKLLISVLKKEIKTKAKQLKKNKSNLKIITDSTNTQGTISVTEEKIDLTLKNVEKEKPLIKENLILEEKRNELSSDDVAANCKKDSQQTQTKILELEKNVQISIPEKVQKEETIGDILLNTNLPLPEDYQFLLKVFTCIDSAAMMLYKRRAVITFKKLQPVLQNMSGRTINLEDLGKIHTLFPEAFSFKRKEMLQLSDPNKTAYEIILEPLFDCESNSQEENETVLSVRKKKFYNALLDKVKCEHENFLKETSKSSSVIRKVKINCWHPNFDVNQCKPIEVSGLEVFRTTKIISPKQVLEKVMGTLKTSQMPTEETSENISKQAEEKDCYLRLPAVAKIIRSIFTSEGKNVLTLSSLTEKLKFSYKVKLTICESEKYIRSLCKFVPEWITLFNLGKCERLKLDKKIPFEKVQKILENLTKNK